MTLRERAEAVDINLDDPQYLRGLDTSYRGRGTLCGHCHQHDQENPRQLCDVQQAEIAAMREQGLEVWPCRICREPHEGDRYGLCPKHEADIQTVSPRVRSTHGRYRDDGKGCVERIHPSELIAQENPFS